MTPMSHPQGTAHSFARQDGLTTGFGPGTAIQTHHGTRIIEALEVGDRVMSASGDVVRLAGVSCIVAKESDLIRVSPAALSETRGPITHAPIIVSHQQSFVAKGWLARAMFGRENALVPLKAVMDGGFVKRLTGTAELPLFQLHFDRPLLIRVAGLDFLMTKTPVTTSVDQTSH